MRSLLLLTMAALLLAACGGGSKTPAGGNTPAPANNASAEVPTEDPGPVALVYELGIEGMT